MNSLFFLYQLNLKIIPVINYSIFLAMPDQIDLEYTKIETLPANTQCFQLDNGK